MALFKFTRGIVEGTPIDIYNYGRMERDFTYVEDLVEAIALLVHCPPGRNSDNTLNDAENLDSRVAPFRVVNIGAGVPSGLMAFLEEIEKNVGKKAIRNMMPMQPGDVPATFASIDVLMKLTGYQPSTPVSVGVKAFVDWYRSYYGG